jgi:membrane protease YdiL (CAAX protease family)
MPRHAAFWLVVVSVLLCGTLGAMLNAWIWALYRLFTGRSLLPVARSKPRAVPWGVGTVVLAFLAFVSISLAAKEAYEHWTGVRKLAPFDQMAIASLGYPFLLLVLPAVVRLTSGGRLTDLGVERRDLGRPVLAGVVGFLLVSPAVYVLNGLAMLVWKKHDHPLEQMVLANPTPLSVGLAFLSAVLLAPAVEELFFRAILQGWLTGRVLRRRDSIDRGLDDVMEPMLADHLDMALEAVARETADPVASPRPEAPAATPVDGKLVLAPIAITSFLFAIVHAPQWPAPIAIFFLSLALGIVYQRTGSLLASFLMHAMFNGFSTLALLIAALAGRPDDPKPMPPATSFWSPGGNYEARVHRVLRAGHVWR